MLAGESDRGTNIQNLVVHAGGVVVKQLPKNMSGIDPSTLRQWLLIANEKDTKKEQKSCTDKFGVGLPFYGHHESVTQPETWYAVHNLSQLPHCSLGGDQANV